MRKRLSYQSSLTRFLALLQAMKIWMIALPTRKAEADRRSATRGTRLD